MIRWLSFIRYPDGITIEEGDRWFLGTRAQELKQLKGICRYLTWKSEETPGARPGRPWNRLTEIGFRDWPSLRAAMANFPVVAAPPWGEPGFEVESIFVADNPEYDFFRDTPAWLEAEHRQGEPK